MKEHKRLADEQPEDGQVCDVRFYFPAASSSILHLGEMTWDKNGMFFYANARGAYFNDPERIWWRVKG